MVKNFAPIRFFNYSLIEIHQPTNDSEEEAKDQFYEQLEQAYAACPSHDVMETRTQTLAGKPYIRQHSPDGHTFNQIDHSLTEDTLLTSSMLCRGGVQTSIQTTC
jgi:hypothetical protein